MKRGTSTRTKHHTGFARVCHSLQTTRARLAMTSLSRSRLGPCRPSLLRVVSICVSPWADGQTQPRMMRSPRRYPCLRKIEPDPDAFSPIDGCVGTGGAVVGVAIPFLPLCRAVVAGDVGGHTKKRGVGRQLLPTYAPLFRCEPPPPAGIHAKSICVLSTPSVCLSVACLSICSSRHLLEAAAVVAYPPRRT